MRLLFLTGDQQEDLDLHLRTAIEDVHRRADAIAAIDLACASAASHLATSARVASDERQAWHRRMTTVARTGRAFLQQLHEHGRPVWNTADVDWSDFERTLAKIVSAAEQEAEATPPRRGAGRPSHDWRDALVSVVFSAYPPGTATRSHGSHFEKTIETLLEYLGRDVENVHDIVIDALRRRPTPPYTVHASKPDEVG